MRIKSKTYGYAIAIFIISTVALITLFAPYTCFAHESWVIPPAKYQELFTQQKPYNFTHLTKIDSIIIIITLLINLSWIIFGKIYEKKLFPALKAKLSSYKNLVAVVIRMSFAITLFDAAYDIFPRVGTSRFAYATFFTPDLDLHLLTISWHWIPWFELLLAFFLFFGIYTRFTAFVCILFATFGFFLFGIQLLPYYGIIIAGMAYLIMQGAGTYFIRLPVASKMQNIVNWLNTIPLKRAQFILRIFSGITFLYTGFYFKILHPNLSLYILMQYNIPTFGMRPETLVLIMGMVECSAGILILAGPLIRFMSVFLFGAFMFFVLLIPQDYFLEHAMLYGILFAFFINGSGKWRSSNTSDK